MKMKAGRNLAILIAGLSIVSGTVYAGELDSFTHEVTSKDYDGGMEHIEWTLAKGDYNLSDNWQFHFDIDKDIITGGKNGIAENYDADKVQGWDTQIGLVQKFGKVGSFDLSFKYLIEYDSTWNTDDGSNEVTTVNYIFDPYFDRDVNLFGKNLNLGIELWAQIGGEHNGSLQDNSDFEANFYLEGDVTSHWNIDLAWYNYGLYDSVDDEYDYQIGTEDYVTYSIPLKAGFSFEVENYIEGYYTPDSHYSSFEGHIQPLVKYTKKIDENFKWYASVGYEVLNYESEDQGKDYDYNETFQNNEMEMKIGFKVN